MSTPLDGLVGRRILPGHNRCFFLTVPTISLGLNLVTLRPELQKIYTHKYVYGITMIKNNML
jgi:hypothetical protein